MYIASWPSKPGPKTLNTHNIRKPMTECLSRLQSPKQLRPDIPTPELFPHQPTLLLPLLLFHPGLAIVQATKPRDLRMRFWGQVRRFCNRLGACYSGLTVQFGKVDTKQNISRVCEVRSFACCLAESSISHHEAKATRPVGRCR